MFIKAIINFSLSFLISLNLFSQSSNSTIYTASGDTVIVSSFRKEKTNKVSYYLKDQLVLEKKFYYRKDHYGYTLKESKLKPVSFKDFWLDGKLRIEGTMLEGKYNGAYKTFYENGLPQCTCNYKYGKRDGKQLIHFENGQLNTEVVYNNGIPWNIIRSFDKEGNAVEIATLKNGTGTFYIYDRNSKPLKIEHYKLGVLIKTEKIKK